MADYMSLSAALGGSFEKPLADLPEELKKRVENEFPIPWGKLSFEQRHSIALQCDGQRDSATEPGRESPEDFFIRMNKVEENLAVWENIPAENAIGLEKKETRLAELRRELASMEQHKRNERGDYPPPISVNSEPKIREKAAGHLNHDLEMQARANQIAAEQMTLTGRAITRDKVAKILAKELDMDEATVLRRIRKQWKFSPLPSRLELPK